MGKKKKEKGTTALKEFCEENQKSLLFIGPTFFLSQQHRSTSEHGQVCAFFNVTCSFFSSTIRRHDKFVYLFLGSCSYYFRRNKYYWFWEAVTDGHLCHDGPVCLFVYWFAYDVCISQITLPSERILEEMSGSLLVSSSYYYEAGCCPWLVLILLFFPCAVFGPASVWEGVLLYLYYSLFSGIVVV